eukprot:ANDGO_05209.mRNA.1 hypothetical protein
MDSQDNHDSLVTPLVGGIVPLSAFCQPSLYSTFMHHASMPSSNSEQMDHHMAFQLHNQAPVPQYPQQQQQQTKAVLSNDCLVSALPASVLPLPTTDNGHAHGMSTTESSPENDAHHSDDGQSCDRADNAPLDESAPSNSVFSSSNCMRTVTISVPPPEAASRPPHSQRGNNPPPPMGPIHTAQIPLPLGSLMDCPSSSSSSSPGIHEHEWSDPCIPGVSRFVVYSKTGRTAFHTWKPSYDEMNLEDAEWYKTSVYTLCIRIELAGHERSSLSSKNSRSSGHRSSIADRSVDSCGLVVPPFGHFDNSLSNGFGPNHVASNGSRKSPYDSGSQQSSSHQSVPSPENDYDLRFDDETNVLPKSSSRSSSSSSSYISLGSNGQPRVGVPLGDTAKLPFNPQTSEFEAHLYLVSDGDFVVVEGGLKFHKSGPYRISRRSAGIFQGELGSFSPTRFSFVHNGEHNRFRVLVAIHAVPVSSNSSDAPAAKRKPASASSGQWYYTLSPPFLIKSKKPKRAILSQRTGRKQKHTDDSQATGRSMYNMEEFERDPLASALLAGAAAAPGFLPPPPPGLMQSILRSMNINQAMLHPSNMTNSSAFAIMQQLLAQNSSTQGAQQNALHNSFLQMGSQQGVSGPPASVPQLLSIPSVQGQQTHNFAPDPPSASSIDQMYTIPASFS